MNQVICNKSGIRIESIPYECYMSGVMLFVEKSTHLLNHQFRSEEDK